MALEDLQRTHNRVITQIGNTSASNDPKQIPHDATESLLKGAQKLAAGRSLGLSEEETLALVSRMTRRQGHGAMSEDEAVRQLRQAAASLVDVSEAAEIGGVGYKDEPAVDPFGQDQSDYYEYQPGDTQYQSQQIEKVKEELASMEDQDDLGRRRYEKGQVRLKTGVNPDYYDERSADLGEMLPERDQMTPKVALQQTLAAIQGKDAGLEGRLEDEIDVGRIQRAADASIAGEAVKRDSKSFNAEAREANYYKAETAALQERRRLYGPGGTGVAGDRNVARVRINPSTAFGNVLQRPDGIYIDEGGNTVALQGPERPALMGSNTPSNAQALNAPAPQSAIDWVAQMKPDYYEGGRVVGDYPQVDITGTTTEFADRIRGLEVGGTTMFSGASPNIRSLDELQKVVDAIVRVGGEKGVRFGTKEVNPDTGKMTTRRSTNPGTQEVMNLLRYTPAEQERLASALFQLEASKSSGYDNDYKRGYFAREDAPRFKGDVTFDAPDALPLARPDESRAQVARIRPGQQIEGKDIATQLRTLESPGARQPFIGAVIDPATGQQETQAGPGFRTRFNRTGKTGAEIGPAIRKQAEERARKTKKPMDMDRVRQTTVKARLVDEREKRDAAKRRKRQADIAARRGPASPEPNPTRSGPAGYGAALRQVESDAREQSSNMELSDKIREIRRRRG